VWDEVPRLAPFAPDQPAPPTDFVDLLCEFAAAFPAWTRGDGAPVSWRHFSYGVAYLHRAHARASLRISAAVGITHAEREDADQWYRAQTQAAGW
jgi:hypothetical protein